MAHRLLRLYMYGWLCHDKQIRVARLHCLLDQRSRSLDVWTGMLVIGLFSKYGELKGQEQSYVARIQRGHCCTESPIVSDLITLHTCQPALFSIDPRLGPRAAMHEIKCPATLDAENWI
ncbi:hypothetical protein COCSUDRAFT_33026 [Coccomyxa subellipsoidea C-169]|uniref:Uncharacterized protein n=1 Tax=Coccomyxa subellipsoidea (strain C-169) TaxID=574566 RepID=I0Z0X1_COCSC|nr:hypothetical protein COCSUDRAFT_33026 [Coccomyxa subellipsoidea C-169]EIE24290.1 hypothetical protein COCSUDRAFT_33026 [Coccomyxa subellipsoidea C-169]|eukprot:XP_005648834.1 hypothetical protein COCSUDRAFT_33026 [Coccomyxa subellipsoidea C-169]